MKVVKAIWTNGPVWTENCPWLEFWVPLGGSEEMPADMAAFNVYALAGSEPGISFWLKFIFVNEPDEETLNEFVKVLEKRRTMPQCVNNGYHIEVEVSDI